MPAPDRLPGNLTAQPGGPAEYQSYIARSKAELMIPKQMYVDSNSGLLSDRSICYLASGRPVIAQDTGFGRFLPTGLGLFSFRTSDEVLVSIEALNRDYARQAQAARDIVEEHFDSDKVLTRLLHRVGV